MDGESRVELVKNCTKCWIRRAKREGRKEVSKYLLGEILECYPMDCKNAYSHRPWCEIFVI